MPSPRRPHPRAPRAADPAPPYPPSPVIAGIDWAPADTIVRRAQDGDNWPVTWADDDALYTTFGDGTGFPPRTERKLSLRVRPGHRRRRPTSAGPTSGPPAEQLGDGRKGKKGWGILSVGGTLYLWLGHADRNGAAAQLAWSKDHAKTWTFADWRFDEFGLVGFVNFGKDYAGARDEYVYAYSHDGPRADTPADRFVLMRAPKGKLTDRAAWEFLEKVDGGKPVWTADVRRRGAAFAHPGGCLRSAMTYNAGPAPVPVVAAGAAAGGAQGPRGHPVRRRVRGVRRPGAVGPVDDRVLHPEVGRRARGARRLPGQVDERRRPDRCTWSSPGTTRSASGRRRSRRRATPEGTSN